MSELVESGNELVSHISQLFAEYTDAPESAVSELESTVGEYVDEVEAELAEANERSSENAKTIEDHEKRHQHTMEDICEIESRLDDIEASNPRGMGGEDGTADELIDTIGTDWTPIERNALMDHDELKEHCGPSDRRGTMIFKNWDAWSTKTPKGKLMKTRDSLKSLLSTATDEHLAWKQVYRACRRVEQLSKGTITFFQHDKHGWMLKQHSAFTSHQATNAGVTPSSVTP